MKLRKINNNKYKIIIGINFGQDEENAIIKNGKVLDAIEEEKVS
jgi:hypothetical protein